MKWVLVIPHILVLIALWAGFLVLTLVAMVAIVVTGRYPRPLFDYNVGVLRWTWRVSYYAYGALGTDQYPPFSLADRDDYPARLQVEYPEHLSRGLALVKWWLLAIPQYLLVGIFVGGGAWVLGALTTRAAASAWSALLVFFAAVALLFTGSYPRPVFDLVLGLNRWCLRVAAYAGLMTDRYPPFRLDQGGDDPGSLHFPEHRGGAPGRWTAGRTVAVTLPAPSARSSVSCWQSGGAGLLVFDQAARDDDGYREHQHRPLDDPDGCAGQPPRAPGRRPGLAVGARAARRGVGDGPGPGRRGRSSSASRRATRSRRGSAPPRTTGRATYGTRPT